MAKTLWFLSLLTLAGLQAQERTVDATWLRRELPTLTESRVDLSSATCHYKAVFGAPDKDSHILRSVARFGELTVDAHGSCQSVLYKREEEILFIVRGRATLQYAGQKYAMRANDFTYVAPGVGHGILNDSTEPLRVLFMSFTIPPRVALGTAPEHPAIFNLGDVKEETVQGHPTSVLYKLLVGPKDGKRDAIDQAYVVTSLFSMRFEPGGTNFPHHHESAEEIYLVISGEGEMVAGSGMDGIEGRFPARAGDAYYFRPNCTVGFYNKGKPGAEAYILAVRSRIPLGEED